MDIYDRKKRSQIMSRIRSQGTLIERNLYSIIRQTLGKRRRIDTNTTLLPGRPDIIIPSLHLAIFAHGCFYHGCEKHGHIPKSNENYWIPKIAMNRQRDKRNCNKLRKLGFSVWVIWEHSLEGKQLYSTQLTVQRRFRKILRDTDSH